MEKRKLKVGEECEYVKHTGGSETVTVLSSGESWGYISNGRLVHMYERYDSSREDGLCIPNDESLDMSLY
jgi:hypothetical protein